MALGAECGFRIADCGLHIKIRVVCAGGLINILERAVVSMAGKVVLKAGREKPVRQRHPWIFGGAIARIDDAVADGAIADVVSADGAFLARGYVNRKSQIVARLLTWDEKEPVDAEFWRARLRRAMEARSAEASAIRLVSAENDGLPGLVIDRYGDFLVLQSLTLGIEAHKDQIVQALAELSGAMGIYERSDADVREKEGLAPSTGQLWGSAPPELIEITEASQSGRALKFEVDVRRGHKTGFYLDQRVNRRRAAAWCRGCETLNLFAYTGGFAVHALAEGARRVVNVDASGDALRLARRTFELNGFTADDRDFIEGNVFEVIRRFRNDGRKFDAIICDPPKLVFSAGQLDRGARAYKDLNLVAMQLLNPGGILATFSCSGLVSPDLFQKIVFGASVDARRDVQILEKLGQPPDHPILLSFPEGEYLKGLLCRVA